jgi:hypothetical protein
VKTIERRLAALESDAGIGIDRLVVVIGDVINSGPITGYRAGDELIRRLEGEDKAIFKARAAAEIRTRGCPFIGDVLVLHDVR